MAENSRKFPATCLRFSHMFWHLQEISDHMWYFLKLPAIFWNFLQFSEIRLMLPMYVVAMCTVAIATATGATGATAAAATATGATGATGAAATAAGGAVATGAGGTVATATATGADASGGYWRYCCCYCYWCYWCLS